MNEILTALYPWTKAAHVISATSWMVGLLYLPRLFVYHASEAEPGTDASETFKVMERRLLRLIMRPAMMMTWFFGLMLVLTPGTVNPAHDVWFQIKFICVVAMTGFHFWLGKRQNDFAEDRNSLPARTYRIMNEVPTLLMIVIVVMVIVRPFS
jgi:protoporphyrinogen IX oxidase